MDQTNPTILFTRSPGVLSALVRLFTRSSVSHVGLGFILDGVPVVIHAYGFGGVQIDRRSVFLRGRTVVAEYAMTRPVRLKTLIADLGDRYDYESLLWFAPAMLLRLFGRKLRKPWSSADALVCSELVAQLPIAAFADLDPEDTTPQDLLDRCTISGEVHKIE